MRKTLLLASFIFPERVDWFLDYLNNKFDIPKDKVFCYENLDDKSKVIITFKLVIKDGKHLNLKDLFPNAISIHKKGDALYTINALNKLIDQMEGNTIGNTDYKGIKIDWDKHQNKLMVINDKKLLILRIKRVF